jgi:hypothetical protein
MKILEHCERDFYPRWEEASKGAQRLGIVSPAEYNTKYKNDPRLPSSPREVYKDFPGFGKFLGTNHYATWQEASVASIKLGIKSAKEYSVRYKEDIRLPAAPQQVFYRDFPGYPEFLGQEPLRRGSFYPTWQKASAVAKKIGFTSRVEYSKRYREDSLLPSQPNHMYTNFPGWKKFLGKK